MDESSKRDLYVMVPLLIISFGLSFSLSTIFSAAYIFFAVIIPTTYFLRIPNFFVRSLSAGFAAHSLLILSLLYLRYANSSSFFARDFTHRVLGGAHEIIVTILLMLLIALSFWFTLRTKWWKIVVLAVITILSGLIAAVFMLAAATN